MTQSPPIGYNRLLDYRSWEQLSRLTDRNRADLLEEICRQEPSKEAWQAICELFALWPENEEMRRNLALAGSKLANWDDSLRFSTSAKRYLYDGEVLASLASLVKSIDIYRREGLGNIELRSIARSEHVRLTRLSISRSEISSQTWQTVLESPYFTELRHLHLRNLVFRRHDARQLFRSSGLPRLRCLKLVDLGLNQELLEDTQALLPFTELRRIDFSRNLLGDAGVLFLSKAPLLVGIERLELRHNYVTASAITALLSSQHCQRLQHFDVSDNELSGTEKATLMKLAGEKHIALIA